MSVSLASSAFRALPLVAVLGSLAGCRQQVADWPTLERRIRARFPDVAQLSIEAYERDHAQRALLVDVREDEEYAVSHIPGAVHARTIPAIVDALHASGASEVVLYCSVGYRSSAVAERLAGKVDVPVYDLEGSIFAWANSGRPVVRDGEVVEQVHPYDEEWGALLDPRLHAYRPR